MAQRMEIDAATWRIEVANGPNAGARVALPAGRHRLGYDSGNDIVFADPAIASEQAMVEIGPCGATLTALAPGAFMQRRRVQVGRRLSLRPDTEIRLGETVLRIAGPPPGPQPMSPWKAGIAALILGVPGTAAAYWLSTPTIPPSPGNAVAASDPRQAVTAASAATAMQTHLASSNLAGAVRIATAGNVLMASGAILPTDRPSWLDAQKWFDGHFAGRVALIDHVGIAKADEMPNLDLAAVSMMPIPNVVTRDGDHYTKGAVLQGGWEIDSIVPNCVTLRLGTRVMRVTL